MAAEQYEQRYQELRERYRDLSSFIDESEHVDGDRFAASVTTLGEFIDMLGELVDSYVEIYEDIEENDEKFERNAAKAEVMKELAPDQADADFGGVLDNWEAESEQMHSLRGELADKLDRNLTRAEEMCSRLGKLVATTDEYEPTSSSDDIDATTKAELDDLLRDVSEEDRTDWYGG